MSKRILLVASNGGHWVQLRRMRAAFDDMERHYVSTNIGLQQEVSPDQFHQVPDANLDEKLDLIRLAFAMFWILVKTRPDVVFSTGAAPGFFALVFGKMLGARTIWVDSCANAEQLSVSGRKIKPFADLWLTQWKHLETPDGPYYRGAVL